MESSGALINNNWGEENRFHFEVLDLPPAVVVKMTYRNRATLSLFAVWKGNKFNNAGTKWQSIGITDNHRDMPSGGYDSLAIAPLNRGPAGKARFLADFGAAGCGGGVTVEYSVYEWGPYSIGSPDQIVKLSGDVSPLDPADEITPPDQIPLDSFPPIGKLRTDGPRITLPYCWFSAIDTFDNPSLCAVDTYDLTGDHVQFVGTTVNRPDLLPVARAIQYAQAHDVAAVRAYCTSDEVAPALVRDMPPFVFGSELNVSRVGDSREIVELGEDTTYHFEVERNSDHWVVAAFKAE